MHFHCMVLCRFYPGLTPDSVLDLTMTQYSYALMQIDAVRKLLEGDGK